MKKIVVSDANIFIDLFKIDLLEIFFQLPFDVWTTDFVVNELTDIQLKKLILKIHHKNKLKIKGFSIDELENLIEFQETKSKKLSLPDCSVWVLTKERKCLLLTGDKFLRISVEKDGLEVSGILFIFDKLIEHKILPKKCAKEKLSKLYSINSRLPKGEVEKRLKIW